MNEDDKFNEQKSEFIPDFVEKAVKDLSWRVRKHVAEELPAICEYLPKDTVNEDICPLYLRLLQDTEPQVRKASILALNDLLPNQTQPSLQMRSQKVPSRLSPMIVSQKFERH
jgi:hypothetical protein